MAAVKLRVEWGKQNEGVKDLSRSLSAHNNRQGLGT